tara:strand:+ start:202 stop:444 length:243 start_codon:yes stop_codon:yes gene_type:complete
MGRAIEVDKRLDNVEADVEKLYEILTELSKVNTTRENIDLHEETKPKKANNETSGAGSGKSNKKSSTTGSKSSSNTTNSK